MNFRLTYEELIGGVLNIRGDHFLTVNGYSNLYRGWGAEDDDLYYR
jgi:beta-1,4-galactosyltransferase 1